MSTNKNNMSDAEQAVHELLSSWGVACNPGEWTEAVDIVQRAIDKSARRPHPAAPVASGGVEVRGVVTGITPRGGFIVEPLYGAFGPQHINCHVSVRFADPTEGG